MKKLYPLFIISVFSFHFSTAQVHQLWGMTSSGGGVDTAGTIFKLNLDGSAFGVAYSFDTLPGYEPYGSLVQAQNGLLYGMASNGGLNDAGVIFHFDPGNNSYIKDFDFDYFSDGGFPQSSLIRGDDELLYGMALSGGGLDVDGTIFSFDPNNATFNKLYDLGDSVGRNPYGYLIQATNGKLYGLTSQGGLDSTGTLFSYDIAGHAFSVLHHFTHATGNTPNGSLLQMSNGKLYGMTSEGGLYDYGVIFSFNLTNNLYTDVYDFNGTTGANPFGSLIKGSDGLLYGMTSNGGANSLFGNIFSFDPAINAFTDLFDFNGTNGSSPEGELMQASNGKFYGMTAFGGTNDAGVIFSFDQTNKNYVILHDFNIANGEYPWGDLIEVTMATGIPEKTSLQNIQLYPNPTTNKLAVNSPQLAGKKAKIEFYNTVGEKVYGMLPTADCQLPATIDVSSLTPGMYFIQVTNENDRWNGKFVKE